MNRALNSKFFWRWAPHVISIELKKALSYRLDFWVLFFVGTLTEIAVAYFLWKAIFRVNGSDEMHGFSLQGIVYYYFFSTFALRLIRGNDRGYISQDIYDGGLTRYLLYPLPFLGYKYVTHVSQQVLAIVQLLLGLAIMFPILGLPSDQHVSVSSVVAGTLTCLFAGYLHFTMASCLEMVAFWQDVVWNLMVMLRFILMLLGGGMVPLAFFPEWGRRLAMLTPFPALINFPVQTFLGQITFADWIRNAVMIVFWSLAFTLIATLIWRRGQKQYAGVGI